MARCQYATYDRLSTNRAAPQGRRRQIDFFVKPSISFLSIGHVRYFCQEMVRNGSGGGVKYVEDVYFVTRQ